MLQLRFVHVDGHLGAHEVLQPSSMVEMKVPHDNRLHVLYVVASLCNLRLEFLVFGVIDTSKDIVQG